jgi:hypothetical protein
MLVDIMRGLGLEQILAIKCIHLQVAFYVRWGVVDATRLTPCRCNATKRVDDVCNRRSLSPDTYPTLAARSQDASREPWLVSVDSLINIMTINLTLTPSTTQAASMQIALNVQLNALVNILEFGDDWGTGT